MNWGMCMGVLVMVAGLAGYMIYKDSKRVIPPNVSRHVVALGDSLTEHGGYCATLKAGLPENSIVQCIGHKGQGAKHLGTWLDQEMKVGFTPDDVIVLIGVNDIASGRSVRSIQEDILGVYYRVRSCGARLIAVKLTPWARHARYDRDATRKINEWIKNSPVPDVVVESSALGTSDGVLMAAYDSGDGLHLNSDGQAALGLLIKQQAFIER